MNTPRSDKAFQQVLTMAGFSVSERLVFLTNAARELERELASLRAGQQATNAIGPAVALTADSFDDALAQEAQIPPEFHAALADAHKGRTVPLDAVLEMPFTPERARVAELEDTLASLTDESGRLLYAAAQKLGESEARERVLRDTINSVLLGWPGMQYQMSQKLRAALSQPAPPVVPRATADALAEAVRGFLDALQDGPENLSYLLYEELAEVGKAALSQLEELKETTEDAENECISLRDDLSVHQKIGAAAILKNVRLSKMADALAEALTDLVASAERLTNLDVDLTSDEGVGTYNCASENLSVEAVSALNTLATYRASVAKEGGE